MSSKIVVTGGAGFIGSHVCSLLANRGLDVVVLDNLVSGVSERLDNLGNNCRFVFGDVRDLALLKSLLAEADAVIHLAAEPSVQLSIDSPLETHSINYGGTMTLLEAMRESNVKRIIYASSAAVYPQGASGPLSEAVPAEPASPYGLDKLAGEHLLRIYNALHGINATALRFFNVYGERQNPGSPYSGVISRFIGAILADQPLTLYGSGKQSRDFVYAGDVAAVILDLLPRTNLPNVMNVATGNSTTLLELIDVIEKLAGHTAKVDCLPPRHGDIFESRADISLLREHASKAASTTLSEGLKRTLNAL